MSDLLYTVQDIFSAKGYLSANGKSHFNIPLYQRGYKWQPHHAEKLLEDINNFKIGKDTFYCLQNITLVPHENHFNIVDGQQRLTTLTLLLNYLGEHELVNGKVQFPENSIRKYTNEFLNVMLPQIPEELQNETWSTFKKRSNEFDHQDIYHLFKVNQAINSWFIDHVPPNSDLDDFKQKYKSKLLKHVKFIVNNIANPISEEKIFGNLNSKRIPLDGADLVRAILVTRVAKEQSNLNDEHISDIVMVNERRVKLGWEIDQINNWWSQDNIKGYFSKFCSIASDKAGLVDIFDTDRHPINLLYKLYAESKGESVLTLELIEQQNNQAISLYKALLKLHHTLQDWFNDEEIYHYLGYLFFQGDSRFKSIWDLWNKTETRQEFLRALKKRIRKTLEENDELIYFEDINTNWYLENSKKRILPRILILMDVIHVLKSHTLHIPYYGFSKLNNDIEHIFPQTPDDPKDKKAYVAFLNKHVVPEGSPQFDLNNYDELKDDEAYIRTVDEFINQQVADIKIHSIGNLVLLNSSKNRSLSNSSYAEKRSHIIQFHNSGEYIQPHTFQVFVRYFNDANNHNNDYEHWTNLDIEANAKVINDTINKFFKK